MPPQHTICRPYQIGPIFAAMALISTGCTGNLSRDDLPESATATRTVHTSRGGKIVDFALKARRDEQNHVLIRFAGSCVSSCTLYLAMPTALTCIMPGASFGFHLPTAGTRMQSATAEAFMVKDYPTWVRVWIDENGGLTKTIKFMRYSYAAQHIPPCQDEDSSGGKARPGTA
jgi:hypothetical protein